MWGRMEGERGEGQGQGLTGCGGEWEERGGNGQCTHAIVSKSPYSMWVIHY